VVVIDADQPQKIENVLEADLIFLAICTPRFELHNYRECDETENKALSQKNLARRFTRKLIPREQKLKE